jgi:hypothetical protein
MLAFAFSFLILISVWTGYTGVMSVLPMENRMTRILNATMRFAVLLETYLLNLATLFGRATETIVVGCASVFHPIDMTALVIILAPFIHELAIKEKSPIAP